MEKFGRVHDRQVLEKIAELDAICFGPDAFEYLVKHPDVYGEIYALQRSGEGLAHSSVCEQDRNPLRETETPQMLARPKENQRLIGYAVYGQVWLSLSDPNAYITRIGVQPKDRQQGWGLRIVNAILSDLSNRPECCNVYADIRQSNIASQRLFQKAGFSRYSEWDGLYTGTDPEPAIRVMKPLHR